MCYMYPPGGAGLLFRPEFDDSCAPRGLHDLLYAPPGGAGLLIRPEVMFHVPPGSLHDVLYALRGFTYVIGTPGGVDVTMYFFSFLFFLFFPSLLFILDFQKIRKEADWR